MNTVAGQSVGPIVGLIGAGVLIGASIALFVLARRKAHRFDSQKVRLPAVGGGQGIAVGVPTVLTAGLAFGISGYHAAAYSLQSMGQHTLPTMVPSGLWWVFPVGTAAVVGLSLLTDLLESPREGED